MTDWSWGYSCDDFVATSGRPPNMYTHTNRVRTWAWPGALLRAYHVLQGGEFGYITAPAKTIERCRTMLRQQAGRLQEHVRR